MVLGRSRGRVLRPQSFLYCKGSRYMFSGHLWASLPFPFKTPRFKSRSWHPQILLVGMLNSTISVENSLRFLKMLNIKQPSDPVIAVLGIYVPRKLKMYIHTNAL